MYTAHFPSPVEDASIVMRIEDKNMLTFSENGITFHRENFPDFTPDDFAEKFLWLIENTYDVKFTKPEL